jgi:hypothetical protein
MTVSILPPLKSLLSGRKVSIAILIIAILGRLLQVLFFFNIRSDRSFQLLATTNLLKGHGVTFAEVYTNDLSRVIYTPLINWPPAYSFIMAPIYSLCAHNYLIAALVLDMIASIILIVVSRAILKLLELPSFAINLFTIVSGFFIYPFYFISSTDSLGVTVFIIAVYFTFRFLRFNRASFVEISLLSVCLFLCGSLKYLFMPIVFVPPVYLLMKGIFTKSYIFKKIGVLSLAILSAGLGLMFLYQLNRSGSAAYVSTASQGFFPQNLLEAYPFIFASFLNPATLSSLLSKYFNANPVYTIFQIVNIVLLIFIGYGLTRLFSKGKFQWCLSKDFYLFSALVTITLLLLLSALSVRIAKTEELPGNWWTFIQEPRYYGVPIVLIHLSIFLSYDSSFFKLRRVWKYIFYLLCSFLLIETLHGITFSVHRLINLNKEEYSWQGDLDFQHYADQVIRNLRKEHNIPLVVYSSSYYFSNRVALYSNLPVLYKMDSVNELNTRMPVVLLEMLKKEDLVKSAAFLKSKPVGYYNGFYFYSNYVQSH